MLAASERKREMERDIANMCECHCWFNGFEAMFRGEDMHDNFFLGEQRGGKLQSHFRRKGMMGEKGKLSNLW
jgi:hypothetical protein